MLNNLVFVATIAAASLAFTGQDAGTQAAPSAQDESITVKGKQNPRDKRVCKRAVTTGSIMPKVTCKTFGEWELERERQLAQREQLLQQKRFEDQARTEKTYK